jgi:hypothetical protein
VSVEYIAIAPRDPDGVPLGTLNVTVVVVPFASVVVGGSPPSYAPKSNGEKSPWMYVGCGATIHDGVAALDQPSTVTVVDCPAGKLMMDAEVPT